MHFPLTSYTIQICLLTGYFLQYCSY